MTDPRLVPYLGTEPRLGAQVLVADTARVVGDVVIGAGSSIWYGAVVRGDVHPVRIGARTNIQDLCVVHVTAGRYAAHIEDDVTVGHRAVIHGCRIRRGALIGMGAIVLDGAEVGEEALVAAGAVVTPGSIIPPRTLALGAPARPRRPLRPEEIAGQALSAQHYAALAARYLAAGQGCTEDLRCR